MTEPTDDLRQAITMAICGPAACNYPVCGCENSPLYADAAIAAYRSHPDSRVKDLTPEGCQCGHDDQCAFAARAEKAEAEVNVWRSAHDVQKKHAWQAIARAEKAEAERDAYRTRLKIERICMTCVLGAPEHYGCTDCMNTGYESGEHPSYCEGYNSGWIAGRDAAAEVAGKFNGAQHAAHDIATGLPWRSTMQDATAAAIRDLTPPEPAP